MGAIEWLSHVSDVTLKDVDKIDLYPTTTKHVNILGIMYLAVHLCKLMPIISNCQMEKRNTFWHKDVAWEGPQRILLLDTAPVPGNAQ